MKIDKKKKKFLKDFNVTIYPLRLGAMDEPDLVRIDLTRIDLLKLIDQLYPDKPKKVK